MCARYALEGTTDNSDAFGRGDYLFINVLPQNVGAVIEELKRLFPQNLTLQSLGSFDQLRSLLGGEGLHGVL